MASFEDLLGKTLTKVEQEGDDELHFYTDDSRRYKLHHYQDCCENVYIEDICGDLEDLVGSVITGAVEVSAENEEPSYGDEEWTFYKLDTAKGGVTIRWHGSSNGYYSISVCFNEINIKED